MNRPGHGGGIKIQKIFLLPTLTKLKVFVKLDPKSPTTNNCSDIVYLTQTFPDTNITKTARRPFEIFLAIIAAVMHVIIRHFMGISLLDNSMLYILLFDWNFDVLKTTFIIARTLLLSKA